MTDHRDHKIPLRTTRTCATPGCKNKPEVKTRLCIHCQLAGLPDPPRHNPNQDLASR